MNQPDKKPRFAESQHYPSFRHNDFQSGLPFKSAPEGSMSGAFQRFISEAPEHASAWLGAISGLEQASGLEKKTEELAYLSVLAAMKLTTGIAFHVQQAKKAGASRKEIIGAILIGLPAAGNGVIQSLPAALEAFDQSGPEVLKPVI